MNTFLNELRKYSSSVIKFANFYNTIPNKIDIDTFFTLEFKYQYGILETFFYSYDIIILATNKAYITMYYKEPINKVVPYTTKTKDNELLIDQYDIYNDPNREKVTDIYKVKEKAILSLFKLMETPF